MTPKRVLVLSALPGPTTIGMHNPHYCECKLCKPLTPLAESTAKLKAVNDSLENHIKSPVGRKR